MRWSRNEDPGGADRKESAGALRQPAATPGEVGLQVVKAGFGGNAGDARVGAGLVVVVEQVGAR